MLEQTPAKGAIWGLLLVGSLGCSSRAGEQPVTALASNVTAPAGREHVTTASGRPPTSAKPAASGKRSALTAAAQDDARQSLERLLTKTAGEVSDDAARVDPGLADILRAICDRVVVNERGKLGCDACIACNADGPQMPSEVVANVFGRFSKESSRQTLVVMWAASGGYDFRYFMLARRDAGWRVASTVVLYGLPIEQQVLHSRSKPDVLVRTSVSAGAPGPTAVEVVNFSGAQVAKTTLASELLPFDACAPSAVAPDRVLVQDVDADGRQDVVIKLADYSEFLASRASQEPLQRACVEGRVLHAPSRSRRFAFIFDGTGFTAPKQAVSLLGLERDHVEPELTAWELEPQPSSP
jgi:hypothetical protein